MVLVKKIKQIMGLKMNVVDDDPKSIGRKQRKLERKLLSTGIDCLNTKLMMVLFGKLKQTIGMNMNIAAKKNIGVDTVRNMKE